MWPVAGLFPWDTLRQRRHSRPPLAAQPFLSGEYISPGGGRGLQNRWVASDGVTGGFDSHVLPPCPPSMPVVMTGTAVHSVPRHQTGRCATKSEISPRS